MAKIRIFVCLGFLAKNRLDGSVVANKLALAIIDLVMRGTEADLGFENADTFRRINSHLAMSNPFFDQPILNSPYACPLQLWELDDDGLPTQKVEGFRRKAKFFMPISKPKKRKNKDAAHEGCVEENTNTASLVRNLLSHAYADKIIVTTIQRLGLALDENSKRNKQRSKNGKPTYKEHLESSKDKRIVFIFEECHRSQFSENHQTIKEFFPKDVALRSIRTHGF